MAAIAATPRPYTQALALCSDTAGVVVTLFSKALRAETGLGLRSPGRALLIGNGAINIQVPSADGPQTLTGAGMVLRIVPTNTSWVEWPEMGPQYQYREYDMGLAQLPTPAQRIAGDVGPIVGASQITLRVVLRLEQGQCRHMTQSGRPAAVAVLSDTVPRTRPRRAWSLKYPMGVYVLESERAPSGNPTTETQTTQSPQEGSGPQEPGPLPLIIRAGAGQEETGEVHSGGTHDVVLSGPAPKRRCVATSTLGGHRVLGGRGTSLQPLGARSLIPLLEGQPRQPSPGVGGRVPFIKATFDFE